MSDLKSKIKPFAQSDNLKSSFELIVTVVGYLGSVAVVYVSFTENFWLGYVLGSVVMCFFIIKVFVLFHDCTHDSMFSTRALNIWTGRVLAIPFAVPFTAWKLEHSFHHDHIVDIEGKNFGEVPIFTVEEFKNLSKTKQLMYRIYRHPLFYIFVAPVIYFLIKSRFSSMPAKESVNSVRWMNVVALLLFGTIFYYFGFWSTVFVFGPATYVAGIVGVTLFYLQHDYPGVHWFKKDEWTHDKASLEGSSLIVFPQPLEWFTHAIGYHHIHHLNSKIPGYKLHECYDSIPELQKVKPMTWADTRESFRLKLWSFEKNSLVHFSEIQHLKN